MTNNTLLITFAKPDPEQLETFGAYVGASTELAIEAGGEVSSRFQVEHLHGDAPASVFGFATFPSSAAITDMFDSDAYQALIPDRDKSVVSVNAYIVEDPSLMALDDPTDGAVYLAVVAAPNPEAMDDLATYQQASGPIFGKHGAAPVAQLPISGHPVGDTPAAFVSILRLPSADAARAVFADPAYVAVVDIRDRALSSLDIYATVHPAG